MGFELVVIIGLAVVAFALMAAYLYEAGRCQQAEIARDAAQSGLDYMRATVNDCAKTIRDIAVERDQAIAAREAAFAERDLTLASVARAKARKPKPKRKP